MGSAESRLWSVSILLSALLFSATIFPVIISDEPALASENKDFNVTISEDNWNQTGVSVSGLTVTDDGDLIINRPGISWQAPNQTGLPIMKTGAGAVPVPDLGEIWIVGGKDDANPQQNGDEMYSNLIEAYNIDSQTMRTVTTMPKTAAYAGAELIGDKLYVIGNWWPGTNNPSVPSTGEVIIYDLTTDSWSNASQMPSNVRVGHAGVCQYGGYIWVAGGVTNASGNDASNRTLRYDPGNDTWIEVSRMNNSRFGFALVPFEDKLYALGGGERTTSWGAPTPYDIVEVYDPSIDNWTQLNTTMPKPASGVSGVVHHNEIVLVGGIQSSQVVAWSPNSDTWRTLSSLPTNIGDMAVATLNGTIHTFGGDMSNFPYGTWGQMFSEDIFYVSNISSVEGYMTSDILDLRPNNQASAQPRDFSFSATQPQGTMVELQYRSGIDSIATTSQSWKGPDGTISTWYVPGNHELNISGKANFFQYRARLSTTALSTWDLPSLENVTIQAAHSAFIGTIPSGVNIMGIPLQLTTEHADDIGFSAWLKIQPVATAGSSSGEPSVITIDDSGGISITDPQQFIYQNPSAVWNNSGTSPQVEWSVTISDSFPSNDFILSTGNLANGQSMNDALSHVHLTSISINNDVTSSLGDVTNAATGEIVSSGKVVPALTELLVNPTISFDDGTELQQGEIEWRLLAETVLTNGTGWYNWSEDWTTNETDALSIPEGISGICSLSLQARTSIGVNLNWDEIELEFVIDGDHAILIQSTPENASYIDRNSSRDISLMLGDSGGPEHSLSSMEVWIEGAHDFDNDGVPQDEEFVEVNFTVEGYHGIWWVNSTINESSNPDHGTIYLRFSGYDRAGHPIGEMGNGISIMWETRDSRLSEIIEVTPLTSSYDGLGQLIEPMNKIGWEVTITDFNSLDDILELKLFLGNDQTIGVKWDGVTEICQELGEWIDYDRTACSSSSSQDSTGRMVEVVSLEFAVNWNFEPNQIVGGDLSIVVTDIDGANESWREENQWYFSKQVNGSSLSIYDYTGNTTGEVYPGYIGASLDEFSWNSYIEFMNSGNPINGPLVLYWSGTIKQNQWQGSTLVEAVEGYVNSSFTLPETNGELIGKMDIWDPLENQILLSIDLPQIIVDGIDPVLQTSQKYVMESRYALDDVVIVANIQETTAWTGNLTIDCQVRSFEVEWPVYRLEAPPDSTFADLVLFQFNLDIQHLGDASLLPEEATFACWVSGMDDAGNQLDSQGRPNQAIDPWLELPLPSIGPDLTTELLWKDDVSSAEIGKEILVGLSVQNIDQEIDKPIEVEVWLEYSDESHVVYRNKKMDGMGESKTWTMTFAITPNSTGEWKLHAFVDYNETIAELNETNNGANISLSIIPEDDGFMGNILSKSNLVFLVIFIGAISITVFILKRKNGSTVSSGPKKGPPPASFARVKPTESMPSSDAHQEDKQEQNIDESATEMSKLVPSWESLPPGGQYEYRDDGTWYVGLDCGEWKQNEDGSFSKMI